MSKVLKKSASHKALWWTTFQAAGTSYVKVLRQEHTFNLQRAARPVCLEQNEGEHSR